MKIHAVLQGLTKEELLTLQKEEMKEDDEDFKEESCLDISLSYTYIYHWPVIYKSGKKYYVFANQDHE